MSIRNTVYYKVEDRYNNTLNRIHNLYIDSCDVIYTAASSVRETVTTTTSNNKKKTSSTRKNNSTTSTRTDNNNIDETSSFDSSTAGIPNQPRKSKLLTGLRLLVTCQHGYDATSTQQSQSQSQSTSQRKVSYSSFWILLIVSTSIIVGLVGTTIAALLYFPLASDEIQHYNIAFIGNSISFVNDLPRFMESLSIIVPDSMDNNYSPDRSNYYDESTSTSSNKRIQSTITQNSCLHGSLSFRSFLQKGNGMYHKWRTSNALLTTKTIQVSSSTSTGSSSNTDDGDSDSSSSTSTSTTTTTTIPIYDYGACTIKQLFNGYDKDLSYNNTKNIYKNDGMNPCFENYYYYQYLQQQRKKLKKNIATNSAESIDDTTSSTSTSTSISSSANPQWDYIVLNDQTVYPGIVSKRNRSIRSLKKSYVKLFKKCKGNPKPVLLVTYAYIKTSSYYNDNTNTYNNNDHTDDDSVGTTNDDIAATQGGTSYYDSTYSLLGNISTFTSRIYYGYEQYASVLRANLPLYQQPILAPVGLVFLLLYEENYTMWTQLFYDDGYHPSPHGTFVIGAVLYTSIYNKLPSTNIYNSKLYYSTTSSSSSDDDDTNNNNNNNNEDNTNTDDMTLDHLWYNARKMHMNDMGNDHPYPTVAEAQYLLNFVKRIVLLKEIPATLLSSKVIKSIEELESN